MLVTNGTAALDAQRTYILSNMGTGPSRTGDLEQRVRQLLLLQEAVKKVNSILDMEQLLDEIVGSVAETFGCCTASVLLKTDSSDELEMIALRGFSNLRLKGYRFKIGQEGMVGHVAATGEMMYAPDVRQNAYYVPAETSTLSEVDIPLVIRGKLIGVFDAQSTSLDAFSAEQIELLCALADNIAIAVENARLFRREREEKERALREQDEARRIQRALLPETDPSIPGYAIDGFCLELSAVGGDWFDYIHLSDGNWGLVLGDVCGKGMAAALLMAATRSLLRRAASASRSPSQVLARANEAILKDIPEGRFVTLVYVLLDPKTGLLTFANAGHPAPLLAANGREPRWVQTDQGFPLGMKISQYSEAQVQLEPDDRVLLYSDGVIDAANPAGDEYGAARLADFLARPEASAKRLLADVQTFIQGGTLCDDATAIVLRRC